MGRRMVGGLAGQNDSSSITSSYSTGSVNGTDGVFAFGGGIVCYPGSSPTIKNVVIRDCSISGQNGSNGAEGDDTTQRSGRGGWGGGAYGAGIYIAGQEILDYSGVSMPGVVTDPTFINCTIMNNSVTGGSGGNPAVFNSQMNRFFEIGRYTYIP